jgi:hypothetical protein
MFGVVLAVVAPTVLFSVAIWLPRGVRAAGEMWRRRKGLPPPTDRVPIERLAADLRRLRGVQDDTRRSRTRRHAARLAYLDLLVDACERFDISQDLHARRGLALEAETLRVEAELAATGLAVTSRRAA